jgi:hypothetical protein
MKSPSSVELHLMWKECDRMTERHAGRVREGTHVMAASEWARWMMFSGVVDLLEANDTTEPWLVDGKGLRKKLTKLIDNCGEWFALHEHSNVERELQIPRCEMERITQRLGVIEQKLDAMCPATVTEAENESLPASRPGALSGRLLLDELP